MKYIKLYEDIIWDFEEEEEIDQGFNVGDKVILKYDVYEYERQSTMKSDELNKNHYELFNIKPLVSEYKKKYFIITDIEKRLDGELIFKLERKWPWYVAKYWEKL